MLQKESCCSQSSPCVLWNTVLAVQPGHRVHLPRPRFQLDQLITFTDQPFHSVQSFQECENYTAGKHFHRLFVK